MRADHQFQMQLVRRSVLTGRPDQRQRPPIILLVRAGRKSKLYRFDNDSGEWKERGVGQTRLLKNKENQRIRLLMRQEKTLKIRANHLGALWPVLTCCVCRSETRLKQEIKSKAEAFWSRKCSD